MPLGISLIITTFHSSKSISDTGQDKYKWNTLGTKFIWESKNKKSFFNTLTGSIVEIDDISQKIDAGFIN